jgi:hypothetical protein
LLGRTRGERDFSIFIRGPWGVNSTGWEILGSSWMAWIGAGRASMSKYMKWVIRQSSGFAIWKPGLVLGPDDGRKSWLLWGSRKAVHQAS